MRRKDREVTDPEQIREILKDCKVCRVGFADESGVYIVPMNHGYVVEDGKMILYFHGAKEGRKLEMIRRNPTVGIEMDCGHALVEGQIACQYSFRYASIIGRGKAQIVEEREEKLRALKAVMKHQTGKDFDELGISAELEKAVSIIRVIVEEYSCKKYKEA